MQTAGCSFDKIACNTVIDRKCQSDLPRSQILATYGRIDTPSPKISAGLKHKVESSRESIKAFSMPFYSDENHYNPSLGLTASFDKILDSYNTTTRSIPQAAMDAINFAGIDIVNFVEHLVSKTDYGDYEKLDFKVFTDEESDDWKCFKISREAGGDDIEFTYTLQPENKDQKLTVSTQANDSGSIKNIALSKTIDRYQDTFGINFEPNGNINYHSLYEDVDSNNNFSKIPIKTIAP